MSDFILNLIVFIGSPLLLVILVIWAYIAIHKKARRTKLKWDVDDMFRDK